MMLVHSFSRRRWASSNEATASFYQGYNQDEPGALFPTESAPWTPEIFPMTETANAATTPATLLATLLASAPAPPMLAAYRGTLTPQELDAPAKEAVGLISAAAVHDLGWLCRIAVRGDDRFRWLSGMVTNMVNDLAPNSGAWNLVLNAQGRIQGDLHVWRDGDELELEIAADQNEKLIAHLEHFIIMDDAELATLDGETALGLTGPLVDEVLARLSLATLPEPLTSADSPS